MLNFLLSDLAQVMVLISDSSPGNKHTTWHIYLKGSLLRFPWGEA